MAGFNRRAFDDPPPTLLDKLTYDKLNDTYIVDKISHYTIPCNMHRNQTCWVRYPLWEAIADCRCNLTYHDKSRIRNGEAHHPTTMPENLPETEGWVNKVEYEEQKFQADPEANAWVVCTITFHLARPFVNSSGKQYYLGNRNGTWSFYDSNDNLIGSKYKIFNNTPETINDFPIPIPDNCYKIKCNLSSHTTQFGSYQRNSGRADLYHSKFTTTKNIVSRLPLLVNTYKTLNNGIVNNDSIYEIPGENVSKGKFFVQNTKSGQGMTEIVVPRLDNNTSSYFVRNKFSMGDLWVNTNKEKKANGLYYSRIVRFKPHPKYNTEPLIEVLWKSDVFLRMNHIKNEIVSNSKIGMIRPDAVEYSLFDMFERKVIGKGAFGWLTQYNMKMLTRILNGRSLHTPNSHSNSSEAQNFSTDLSINHYAMGSGFVRGTSIMAKGASYNVDTKPQLTKPQPVKFYVFAYLYPHKRHKRTWYKNALHCKWRLFEAPIAKAKFKMTITKNLQGDTSAIVLACNTVM